MTIFPRFIQIPALLLIMFIFCSPAVAAADAGKILKKIQKQYRDTKTVQLTFTEIARFSLTGVENETHSTLIMEGRDKFRYESDGQVLVNNGSTMWKFDKINDQVLIDHAKKTEEDIVLNNLLYHMEDYYFGQILEENKVDGDKIFVIRLTPKPSEQSFFTSIKLWVTDKTWEIGRMIYTDYNDNETEFVIEDLKFNPPLTSSVFDFTPPDGTQVVDLRF